MNIRLIKKDDIKNVMDIYFEYIDTPITFAYTLPSYEEFSYDVGAVCEKYPYLVLEDESGILGYAYAHEFAKREAYKYSVELSIYMRKDCINKGLGNILYDRLIKLLKLQNIKTVYAKITGYNKKSIDFHEKLGFKQCGFFPNIGYKNDKWHSIFFYEKNISYYDENPKEFIDIKKIDRNIIDEILEMV